MPVKVTLTVTQGQLTGTTFGFEGRTTCIIGRSPDCSPQLPDDQYHKTISRHHCLLDINPPDIRVRDFGSLNGTYVNGQKIGQRAAHMTPAAGAQLSLPEYDLREGDELQLGPTVFRVRLVFPLTCAECATEIPAAAHAHAQCTPGLYQCDACRQRADAAGHRRAPTPKPKVCVKCGRDVAQAMGAHRQGDFLCAACQAEPWQIVQHLLARAQQGHPQAQAIQGYTSLRELGKGAMGAVYLARHDQTGEQVALKVMLPQVAIEAHAQEDFLRETHNTRALTHPHVVALRDAGCAEGTFFLTLEYCDGGSVADVMRARGGPFAIEEAGAIVLQALDGLAYAHTADIPYVKLADGRSGRGRGLVHRDIKPGNILLTGAGSTRLAKVGDYGLAKAFDLAGLSGQTRTGAAAGTPHFMPRQQVINFKYAPPEVDVWAMAASFYVMVTGSVPRDFPPGKDKWQVVLQSAPVPIRQRNKAIPARLADVIDLALVDQPDLHFKTATAFKQALEQVL